MMAMYRIEMDAKAARWVVKLDSGLLMWKQVGDTNFQTYDAARKWVDELGLDNVYRDYNRTRMAHVMDGAQDGLQS